MTAAVTGKMNHLQGKTIELQDIVTGEGGNLFQRFTVKAHHQLNLSDCADNFWGDTGLLQGGSITLYKPVRSSNLEQIFFVDQNMRTGAPLQFSGSTEMINMAVGDKDSLDGLLTTTC